MQLSCGGGGCEWIGYGSEHAELLPLEEHVHLLPADATVEVLVGLLGDLLDGVEVLGGWATSHRAKFLVGHEELSSVNLSGEVPIILLEDHFDHAHQLLVVLGQPGTTIIGESARLHEAGLTVTGSAETGLTVTSRRTKSASCLSPTLP